MTKPGPGRRRTAIVLLLGAMAIASCGGSDGEEDAAFCDLYVEYRTSVEARNSGAEPDSDAVDLPEILDAASKEVPDELAEPWAVVLDAQNDFEAAREAAGFDADDPDEEAFESIEIEAMLREAEDDLASWFDENCEPLSEF